MKVSKTVREVRSAVADARRAGARSVGFVPTMGALHPGHYSLIDAARRGCDFVVVSIFVNPTQFAPDEDYRRYPRTIEADLAGCEAHGVDAVFAPAAEEMYGAGSCTTVHVSGPAEGMEGGCRPGHFDGVCTVVAKLFNIVAPDVAYFGAKDYQQAAVVRRMAADLDLPPRIEVCPTVREPDGLAMSSRNAYLSPEERRQAPALLAALRLGERLLREGRADACDLADAMRRHIAENAPLASVDYVEIVDPVTLASVQTIRGAVVAALAVRFPSVRLIDNMRMDPSPAGR